MFRLVDKIHGSYEDLWGKQPCIVLSFSKRKLRKPCKNYLENTCIQTGNVNLQTTLCLLGINPFCIKFFLNYRRTNL